MNDPNPPQVTIIGSGIQVRHQREDGMYIGFERAYNRGGRGRGVIAGIKNAF